MAKLLVRPLGLGDRETWGRLRHALWPHHPTDELRDELTAELAGDFAGFGAIADEKLVGFAEVCVRPYGDGCETAPVPWLEAIYVLPGHRRHGVARQLIEAVEAWARTREFAELGSDAALQNLISRLTHARWGFEETERSVMFRKALR